MMNGPGAKPEIPKPQSDKFRELARDLECDEDEKAFEEKVKRVATAESPRQPKTPSDP